MAERYPRRAVGGTAIAQILDDVGMARFQDPKIQLDSRGDRPFYFIRPVVLRITPHGIKRGQEVKRLGWADELNNKAKREAAKQKIMAEINSGRSFAAAQVSLSYVIEKYREARMPHLASTTQSKYEAHLGKHIEPGLGKLQLFELEPSLIEAWLTKKTCEAGPAAARVVKPMSWSTKADILHILSTLFESAKDWRLFEGLNPCVDVKLGRKLAARQKFIPSQAEVKKLLDALECCSAVAHGVTGPDVALMVRLVIASGWRISEVLGLRPDAIDGEYIAIRRTWHRGEMSDLPKTDAGWRRNFIGPLASEIQKRISNYIFTADNGFPPDDRDLQQHILRPCAEAVKLYRTGFGFHSFRRLNITWRQEAGAHPFEAMILAGHSKPSTTMDYTRVDEGREQKQVGKLMRRIQ